MSSSLSKIYMIRSISQYPFTSSWAWLYQILRQLINIQKLIIVTSRTSTNITRQRQFLPTTPDGLASNLFTLIAISTKYRWRTSASRKRLLQEGRKFHRLELVYHLNKISSCRHRCLQLQRNYWIWQIVRIPIFIFHGGPPSCSEASYGNAQTRRLGVGFIKWIGYNLFARPRSQLTYASGRKTHGISSWWEKADWRLAKLGSVRYVFLHI